MVRQQRPWRRDTVGMVRVRRDTQWTPAQVIRQDRRLERWLQLHIRIVS